MRYDAAKASRPSQSGSDDHQASTSRPFFVSVGDMRRIATYNRAGLAHSLAVSIRRSPLNRGGMRSRSPSAGW